MTDIVERLRMFKHSLPADTYPYNLSAQIKPLMDEAADLIERQAKEIERLREALELIADETSDASGASVVMIASAALKDDPKATEPLRPALPDSIDP